MDVHPPWFAVRKFTIGPGKLIWRSIRITREIVSAANRYEIAIELRRSNSIFLQEFFHFADNPWLLSNEKSLIEMVADVPPRGAIQKIPLF